MRLSKRFRLLTFWVVLVTILLPYTVAHSQMAEFRSQFQAGRCDVLDQPLKSYRSKLRKLGRINLQVDYMRSVCRCRLPGLFALLKLPSVYRHLTQEDQELIGKAVSKCESGARVVASIPSRGAIVWGKGGRQIVRLSDDSADMYAARIFDRDRKDDAVASLRSRGFGTIVAKQNFILTGDIGESALESTGQLMEDVLERLVSQFGFARPRTLITVYLFEKKQGMWTHARKQHRVTIPTSMWAYTFPLDASITIWKSGGLGTVGHEIFHALLDQNAPYAPPWLNEGAAALFEEFRYWDDGIEGTFRLDHWRVPKLRNTQHIPLNDLLAMNWATFDDVGSLQKNHATAKFFVMYLQQQQKLRGVLDEYVRRDLFDGSNDAAILEKQLGKDLNLIAEDFKQWLLAKINP